MRVLTLSALALLMLLSVAGWAEQQNGAGGVLGSITTETDSAAPSLSNAANATAALAGAEQAGADLQNATGARLYIGHLDPLAIDTPHSTPSQAIWFVY